MRLAGQASELSGDQVSHVAADQLPSGAVCGCHIGRVIDRDPVFDGDAGRSLKQGEIGSDEPRIFRDGGNPLAQAAGRSLVLPRPESNVANLIEREIERRQRIDAAEETGGVLVMLVVRVLAGQENAGIQ